MERARYVTTGQQMSCAQAVGAGMLCHPHQIGFFGLLCSAGCGNHRQDRSLLNEEVKRDPQASNHQDTNLFHGRRTKV
jgi:hypothetical protein